MYRVKLVMLIHSALVCIDEEPIAADNLIDHVVEGSLLLRIVSLRNLVILVLDVSRVVHKEAGVREVNLLDLLGSYDLEHD